MPHPIYSAIVLGSWPSCAKGRKGEGEGESDEERQRVGFMESRIHKEAVFSCRDHMENKGTSA